MIISPTFISCTISVAPVRSSSTCNPFAVVADMKVLLLALSLVAVLGQHHESRHGSRHAQNYPDYYPDRYYPYPGTGNPYVPPSGCKYVPNGVCRRMWHVVDSCEECSLKISSLGMPEMSSQI